LPEEVDAVMIGRNSAHHPTPTRLIVPVGSGGARACAAYDNARVRAHNLG